MVGATGLTLLAPFAHGFVALLILRTLTGLCLAATPAVGMAYIAEHAPRAQLTQIIARYIAGTALGGMTGRLVSAVAADLAGWRGAATATAIVGILATLAFRRWAPNAKPSREGDTAMPGAIVPPAPLRIILSWQMLGLFGCGALLMGGFAVVYNYVGFILTGLTHGLSQATAGMIFLLHVPVIWTTPQFGAAAVNWRPEAVLAAAIVLMEAGTLVMLARPLAAFAAGLALFTTGFSAHMLSPRPASASWPRQARRLRRASIYAPSTAAARR